nr:nucleoside diphosphate kinase regulator [Mesorhizobium sp. WSM4875]
MQTKTSIRHLPSIILSMTDYERLANLASAVADRIPDGSDALLVELERAILVADGSMRSDVVRMGSTVAYETDAGDMREITLVFPGDADISQGNVSVLAPIGTALLGLSAGQSIAWTGHDARTHRLTVVRVAEGLSPESAVRAP